MSKKIQLTIADPCHENWDNMTPAEKGRFCASCQKQVIDFSGMSDSQLATYFKKPTAGSVCGRFYDDQLSRDIEIPRKRIPWVKYFFQFALPAFLLSMKAGAQSGIKMVRPLITAPVTKTNGKQPADTIPPLIKDAVNIPGPGKELLPVVPVARPADMTSCNRPYNGRIFMGMFSLADFRSSGVVLNEKGKKISHASIRLENSNTIYSDRKGRFYLPSWVSDSVVLQASKPGYREKEVIIYKKDRDGNLIIRLESTRDHKTSREEIPQTIKSVPLIKQELTTIIASLKLSPNPVVRNSTVYIGFNNDHDEEMQLNIFNVEGNLVAEQSKKIVKGYNQLSVMADGRWAAGIYMVQLRSQKGTIVKQEKLIVQ